MKTLAFRFFNVYGPLQRADHAYAAVVPIYVEAALKGKALPVHGDGTQTRDFTYVDTVAQVLCQSAAHRISDVEPVNLALGTRSSLLDVIATLESLLKTSLSTELLPRRPGDVAHSQASSVRLMNLFPGIVATSLEEGIGKTLSWARTAQG
jgi:UDP-glucose 4-epimerase